MFYFQYLIYFDYMLLKRLPEKDREIEQDRTTARQINRD